MVRVFFVNDTSHSANWGCRATTSALTQMLVEAGGTIESVEYLEQTTERSLRGTFPEDFPPQGSAQVTQPMHRSVGRRIVSRIIRLVPSLDSVPASVTTFERSAKAIMKGQMLRYEKAAIEKSDLVFINGEGSIYDRQRKGRAILFLAWLAKRAFGKPVAIVNHTAQLNHPDMHAFAQMTYPLLDDVVFREHMSLRACRDLVSGRFGADAAFTYHPADRSEWTRVASRPDYFGVWPDSARGVDPSRPYVVVGGSSIYLRPDRPAYNPVPGYLKLVSSLQRELGQVVLIAPDSVDQRILRPVAKETGAPLIGLATPVQQVTDILGNAAGMISGCWHPSILALTGGTPIISLTANTFKTQALVALAGLDGPTFDALRLEESVDEMVQLLKFYVERGVKVRAKILSKVAELRKTSYENVALVRQLRALDA